MTVTLPPRLNAKAMTFDLPHPSIVVVGANGAGKTRFINSLASHLEGTHMRLNALKALYGNGVNDTSATSIDALYRAMTATSSLIRTDLVTEFDRLLALLLTDEVEVLLKQRFGIGNPHNSPTPLERTMRHWQSLFPNNRIHIEQGRMLISSQSDYYSPDRLSDGERAALYYLGAIQYAPHGAVVIVDSPEMFFHPSTIRTVWDKVESLRPDCTLVYSTHDLSFASSRSNPLSIWVKNYDPAAEVWDYDEIKPGAGLSDELYMSVLGARKPVLFIEGDPVRSLDAKLYPLIFTDYTVASLGGCTQVIEATRSFNSLGAFHSLAARGIVDRDRREESEVRYLRSRKIYVPEVAEIENIFMLPDVIQAVALANGRNPEKAFAQTRQAVMRLFATDLKAQALQHTRHRVKKTLEHRIDGRFASIECLEEHIDDLCHAINPRNIYNQLCLQFKRYEEQGDYNGILAVYNRKSMLSESHVARACGLRDDSAKTYTDAIIAILHTDTPEATQIRRAVTHCFGITENE